MRILRFYAICSAWSTPPQSHSWMICLFVCFFSYCLQRHKRPFWLCLETFFFLYSFILWGRNRNEITDTFQDLQRDDNLLIRAESTGFKWLVCLFPFLSLSLSSLSLHYLVIEVQASNYQFLFWAFFLPLGLKADFRITSPLWIWRSRRKKINKKNDDANVCKRAQTWARVAHKNKNK